MNIETIPKTELHVHLEGTIEPATALTLAKKHSVSLPTDNPDELRRFFKRSSRADFFDVWEYIRPLYGEPEDFFTVATKYLEKLYRQNVRLVELRMNPGSHCLRRDLPLNETMSAVLEALENAREKFGMQTGLIFGASREVGMREIVFVAEAALEFSDRGVVGFDISGDETASTDELFREAAAMLSGSELGITLHAGEWVSPDIARRGIEIMSPGRIGHGARMFENLDVVEIIRERDICVELCPTSNVLTQAVSSITDHPLPLYLREGIPFTINTDDPTVFDIDLTGEYEVVEKEFGLGEKGLLDVFENGEKYSFISRAS